MQQIQKTHTHTHTSSGTLKNLFISFSLLLYWVTSSVSYLLVFSVFALHFCIPHVYCHIY